jgi:hypothetical protein
MFIDLTLKVKVNVYFVIRVLLWYEATSVRTSNYNTHITQKTKKMSNADHTKNERIFHAIVLRNDFFIILFIQVGTSYADIAWTCIHPRYFSGIRVTRSLVL